LARHAKQDPEQLLRAASRKFTKRFNYIEQHHFDQHLDIKQSTLAELEALWLAAKNHEKINSI
jgi:ATP diphosphatase